MGPWFNDNLLNLPGCFRTDYWRHCLGLRDGRQQNTEENFIVRSFIIFSFHFICLFYFILFYFILFYFILFCFILFYFILFYFVLFCFILFYFILFYFVLFYFILFYFILFYFYFLRCNSSTRPRPPLFEVCRSHTIWHTHTNKHTHTHTNGRNSLDEWSARRRGRYLRKTHTHTRDEHPCPQQDSNPQCQ
jgi:hypothetical protein